MECVEHLLLMGFTGDDVVAFRHFGECQLVTETCRFLLARLVEELSASWTCCNWVNQSSASALLSSRTTVITRTVWNLAESLAQPACERWR